ncbi:MAG TPA: maleylpyruvate isomerase family mycothiol-dependent enzyme [Micromonosporaceae bacterium]|nr:maleylpyruvate isomerase family mycothiol-dependent enzyme [Micromonosporaceae bacterium]
MPATTALTRQDYVKLMIEESADLAGFLEGLDDSDWDVDSLCTGWKVRHVISHMAVGHTMPMGKFLAAVLAARGVVPRASYGLAVRFGDTHTPEQILAAFRAGTAGPPQGPARFVAPPELFIDHLIHHQDIRRPLGRPRDIPTHRLVAAVEALPRLNGQLKPKRRVRGLTLVAKDIDRRVGEGPEVYGPAEALVMCAGGRSAALDELDGPGVSTLAARLRAEA